MAILK